jgi:hypothetical protein
MKQNFANTKYKFEQLFRNLDCATKCQNTKRRKYPKRQIANIKLQNVELQNIESYRTTNLTERRNTKCQILQNVETQNVNNTKGRTIVEEGQSKVGFGPQGQTQPLTVFPPITVDLCPRIPNP